MKFTSLLMIAFTVTIMSANAAPDVVDIKGKPHDIADVMRDLSNGRAVFVGENHDRYDQHLSELEVIRRLSEAKPMHWAIGVEFIQRPFQAALDAYIAGEIDEREFLKRTEYFDRWGYDFRLYAPIFRFAREHQIPMVALNADHELTEQVSKQGLSGLNPTDRSRLPDSIDQSDTQYRKRIEKVFKQHSEGPAGNFQHFWESQLVWDETMAESVANYLSSHPDKGMVILAGTGHMEYRSGIPNRVRRRMPGLMSAVLITADKPDKKTGYADYFLMSKEETLPPLPRLGIVTEVMDGVRVKSVTAGGAAAVAGIQPRDKLVAIESTQIESLGDVRLSLLDKNVGDAVVLHVQRQDISSATAPDLNIRVTLR